MGQQTAEWIIHDEPPETDFSKCVKDVGYEFSVNLKDLDSIVKKAKASFGIDLFKEALTESLTKIVLEMRIASLEKRLQDTLERVCNLEAELHQQEPNGLFKSQESEWREDAFDSLIKMSRSFPRKYGTQEAFKKWQEQE